MKRVAIFGNAGGGKSTLARGLAAITGLPLHMVDLLEFRPGVLRFRMKNIYGRTRQSSPAKNGSSMVMEEK